MLNIVKMKRNLKIDMNKNILFLSIFSLCLFFLQCRDSSIDTTRQTELDNMRELNVFEKKIVQSDNNFGFKIFNRINQAEKDKSIFISPASISFTLAMTLNGANGGTKDEMQSVLEMQGLTNAQINENFNSLMNLLQNADPKVIFQLANSIWYDKNFIFEATFINDCKKYFNAEIAGLDFKSSETSGIINDWVDKNTNGKIKEIIDKIIDPNVAMYLINAIYFKGSWKYRFDETNTKDANFYLADGKTKSCRMMSQSAQHPYFDNNDFQAVDLQYGNSHFSMTIILPKFGKDLNNIISGLNQDSWNTILTNFKKDSIILSMPKYKLEYDITLDNILKSLGMVIAFTDNADFTSMFKLGGLYISKAKHKAFVDVNEEGTEAAAATSVEISYKSVPTLITMNINHPFVFIIRENKSQSILFMGKISDPKY
jgi:serine protease inhibitor